MKSWLGFICEKFWKKLYFFLDYSAEMDFAIITIEYGTI